MAYRFTKFISEYDSLFSKSQNSVIRPLNGNHGPHLMQTTSSLIAFSRNLLKFVKHFQDLFETKEALFRPRIHHLIEMTYRYTKFVKEYNSAFARKENANESSKLLFSDNTLITLSRNFLKYIKSYQKLFSIAKSSL